MGVEELLLSLLGFWTIVVLGGILLYGTSQKWPWLVDPPEWLIFLQPGDFLMKALFGKHFLLYFTYFIGSSLVIVGSIGVIQRVVLLGSKLGYW